MRISDWSSDVCSSDLARSNDENITVVTEAEAFARNYLDAFEELLDRGGCAASRTPKVDSESVRRRLELIRSLVLLGEQDAIAHHIRKLHPASEAFGLGGMVAAIDYGEYATALELIDDYLHRATALVIADDVDIARLRFELSVLELRLESLRDEKAELDRRLIALNRSAERRVGNACVSTCRPR